MANRINHILPAVIGNATLQATPNNILVLAKQLKRVHGLTFTIGSRKKHKLVRLQPQTMRQLCAEKGGLPKLANYLCALARGIRRGERFKKISIRIEDLFAMGTADFVQEKFRELIAFFEFVKLAKDLLDEQGIELVYKVASKDELIEVVCCTRNQLVSSLFLPLYGELKIRNKGFADLVEAVKLLREDAQDFSGKTIGLKGFIGDYLV